MNPLAVVARGDHPLGAALADEIVADRHVVGASVLMNLVHGADSAARSEDEWLLVALALSSPEGEHSCLDLDDMTRHIPDELESLTATRLRRGRAHWVAVASAMQGLVGTPDEAITTPMVLDGSRLYLSRMYVDECFVAEDLLNRGDRLTVLLGGPGSGKTTNTAKDLLRVLSNAPSGFSVGLAAPTGKAAMRMRTVLMDHLRRAAQSAEIDAEQLARAENMLSATESVTIHRLLGYSRQREHGRYAFDETRALPHDLVIVDECSMISLEMLTNLLRAVRPDAALWIVGDPDQLASVGAGTVLADIRTAVATSSRLRERVTVLGALRRFTDDAVRGLVESVRDASLVDDAGRDEKIERFFELLSNGGEHLTWVDPLVDSEAVQRIINGQIDLARELARLAATDDAQVVVASKLANPRTQMLCVHRNGRFGVAGINERVRGALGASAAGLWYPGRPVMVTRNDSRTGVFNGDNGVVVRRRDGASVVVLSDPIGRPPVPVSRIDHHELAYAMTVHKSQGSEFSHVVALMPAEPSRLCTREMLYTAISRTVDQLTLVATRNVLEHILRTPISRATGLADRFSD